MIRNSDGTPYKLSGKYRQFDPKDSKCQLFSSWDEEIIKIGGSPIFYYEVLIQFSSLDKLYLEDRGKLFSPCKVQLYAFYEPMNQAVSSGLFGADALPDEVVFECNYKAVERALNGKLPKIGSRIHTPHLNEDWILIDRASSEYRGWGYLRMQLRCQKFQKNRTNPVEITTPPPMDFPIT